MEAEVSEQIGAGRYERSESRREYRNGYRDRVWETRVGEIPLQIPKLRSGSYYPSFLEPRRRAERALLAVIQSAYVNGVSTRKVDDLVQALGMTGIDKSKVSRICKELDEAVTAFRNRPLEVAYPYLWLDALYLKVRQNHRIVNMAVVLAVGVRETGEREILAIDIGASEEEAFWTAFLRGLVGRGLDGVQLVISDAHEGLKGAMATVLTGTAWQRCRVHFMRNVLAHVPKRDKSFVAAALRTIFAQPNQEAARQQLEEVLSVDERALVFTQYTEMGTLLRQYLQERFGDEILFLHGGTRAEQRDRMVARFEEEPHGPPVFILSLRAGGLGLNLTRANHIFHLDRWWNPAVEDQATDRAFRIGQTKDVWAHKFISIGTLEERIDDLIESKKALAESVIGTSEAWLTELDTDQIRDIVTLSSEALEN
jgi:transposase-like protein